MILPSLTEGLPFVLLEAAILDTLVLTTDVGYIKELYGNSYPFFIAPYSSSSIANKLNLVNNMDNYGLENVVKDTKLRVMEYLNYDYSSKLKKCFNNVD